MLIRGQIDGISEEVALAAATIPAALPTLLLGGLLLSCPWGPAGRHAPGHSGVVREHRTPQAPRPMNGA